MEPSTKGHPVKTNPFVLVKTCVILAAALLNCQTPPPLSPQANVEGNCTGTIKDANGSPVNGASVLLVPDDYVPYGAGGGQRIDSTVCNTDGRFGFTVGEPGSYNLLARGSSGCSMRKALALGGTSPVDLTAQVLVEPGSLTGSLRLQGTADNSSIIILFLGTNLFVAPSDSSGRFAVAKLAPGQYTLSIITTEKGYAPVETTVTVNSGAVTVVPAIELTKKTTPVVTGFSVTYDPAMMTATMHWQPLDTGLVSGYRIYCNRSLNLEPVACLADTCTGISFDLVNSSSDSLTYHISAIDGSGVEGPAATGNSFLLTSVVEYEKKITYQTMNNDPYNASNVTYYFDRYENIYDLTEKAFLKIDQTGRLLASYRIPDSIGASFSSYDDISAGIQSDAAGNLYLLCDSTPTSSDMFSTDIVKFDEHLNPNSTLPFIRRNISDTSYHPAASSFIVTGSGTLYTIVAGADSQLHVTEYGPDMIRKHDRRCAGSWAVQNAFVNNDTIFCMTTWPTASIRYFDAGLNEIFRLENDTFINSAMHLKTPVQSSHLKFLSPLGIFMTYDIFLEKQPPCLTLLFYDTRKGKLLARFPWHDVNGFKFYFDYTGNMYTVKREYNGQNTTVTITKYSIKKLLRGS